MVDTAVNVDINAAADGDANTADVDEDILRGRSWSADWA